MPHINLDPTLALQVTLQGKVLSIGGCTVRPPPPFVFCFYTVFNRFAHSAGPGMEKHVGTELTTEGARSTQKPKDNGTGIQKNVGTI